MSFVPTSSLTGQQKVSDGITEGSLGEYNLNEFSLYDAELTPGNIQAQVS
jgi:hypothetical protein